MIKVGRHLELSTKVFNRSPVVPRSSSPPGRGETLTYRFLPRCVCFDLVNVQGRPSGARSTASSSSSTAALDVYERLGITPDATQTEVKEAFFKKVKATHPDINPNVRPEEFQLIRQAYDVLSDPVKRLDYDSLIAGGAEARRVSRETEHEEEKALERLEKNRETFYTTKRNLRPNLRWKSQYEWDNSSRSLRLKKDLFSRGYFDITKTTQYKLDQATERFLDRVIKFESTEEYKKTWPHSVAKMVLATVFFVGLALNFRDGSG